MSASGRLAGKIAVITGAARGMGEESARLFVSEGAKVIVADLNPRAAEVAESLGSDALHVALDITSEESWASLVDAATARFGAPDILINNAGISDTGDLMSLTAERFEEVLRINLVGTFSGIKALSRGMIAAGSGSIVNISSTVGLLPTNGQLAYVASKWGVRGMTKAAALELAPLGIRVNSIHPGPINTPMANSLDMPHLEFGKLFDRLPMQRGGRSSEVAMASLFLASDEASYICGAELAVDGGMSTGTYLDLLPGGLSQKIVIN